MQAIEPKRAFVIAAVAFLTVVVITEIVMYLDRRQMARTFNIDILCTEIDAYLARKDAERNVHVDQLPIWHEITPEERQAENGNS